MWSRGCLSVGVSCALLAGCAGSAGVEELACGDEAPRCVAQREGPCGPWSEVAAECSGAAWTCPAGAAAYQERRAPASCVLGALEGAPGATLELEGQCLWPADQGAQAKLGHRVTVQLGSCPVVQAEPTPLLDASELAADRWVELTDSVAIAAGRNLSFYRLYALDAAAPFGLRALAGDLVEHDLTGRFRPHEASLFSDDQARTALLSGGYLYVFRCGGEPRFLSYGCWLDRVPAEQAHQPAAYQHATADRGWSQDPAQAAEVFEAGPHPSVRPHTGIDRFVLTSIAGFGSTIEARVARRPEGPWSEAAPLARCALPVNDPQAFCDGPRQQVFLRDPTHPREIAVSYRIGTLAPDAAERIAAHPEAYAPRVVYAELPEALVP